MYLAVYYLCVLTAGSSTRIVGQLFVGVFVWCFLTSLRDSGLLGLSFSLEKIVLVNTIVVCGCIVFLEAYKGCF